MTSSRARASRHRPDRRLPGFPLIRVEKSAGVTRFVMARSVLGRDLYRAACYLVDGLLVDTGMAHVGKALFGCLESENVQAIVNTHSHEDHIGCNAALQETRGIPVYAHPLAIPVIGEPSILALRPYQRFFFGYPRPSNAVPAGFTISTGRRDFRVMQTPGHSPDHISIYDEERGWLFCGDAYFGNRERVLRADYDVWEMIGTFRSLAALPLETLYTGTGAVVLHPARRIQRKLEYLLETANRVWSLREAGLDAGRIARRLFPSDLAIRTFTSGHFSAENLVRSFLARQPGAIPSRNISA